MTAANDDPATRLRRNVYLLLILVGTAAVLGRILAVDSVDQTAIEDYRFKREVDVKIKKLRDMGLTGRRYDEALRREKKRLRELLPRLRRPFLSGNDRSRWCTVRALVEDELRVMGHPYSIDKVIQEPTWDTIDMVQHDGHLYSSKPPLWPTLMAAEYWLIRRATGMSLDTDPFVVARCMLLTFNLIPLLIYFILLSRLIERFGTTDWGRMFAMAAAVFGTFLTTFAVVINNHLPAAVCAAVAVYAAVRISFDGERRWRYFVVAGLFAALTAANELPALAFFALLSLGLLWKSPLRTLLGYTPAAAVIVAAFFATNWIAHGDLRPPYLHRSLGNPDDNWYDYTYERNGKVYESYWNDPVGWDRGEGSAAHYAMHVLVGHHGVFSLTPVWLLSFAGMAMWTFGARDERRLRELAILIAAVTLVCLAFYLTRPEHHRNYGGMTCGLRWMFWFAPLWLVTMLPAADAMGARRWTRGVALVLLAVSVLSASYPTWNPWTDPWLWHFMYYLGFS